MNRSVSVVAFLLGLAVVVWVGAGYVGLSPLALGMTALIGAVYLTGALELLRFDRATAALQRALDTIPADLPDAGAWLRGLPPALHSATTTMLERKSPAPFTVAKTPNARPCCSSGTSSAQSASSSVSSTAT